jgi:hypothetical protein
MGALTVAYAKDTGDKGKFGDEAETLSTPVAKPEVHAERVVTLVKQSL